MDKLLVNDFNSITNPIFSVSDLRKQFETPPYSKPIALSTQASIRCHPPKGKPTPTLHWVKNGKRVDPSVNKGVIISGDDQQLMFVNAKMSDSGNYTCVAENLAATRESPVAVITVFGRKIISNMFFFLFMPSDLSFVL